jgi:hypothetical protein
LFLKRVHLINWHEHSNQLKGSPRTYEQVATTNSTFIFLYSISVSVNMFWLWYLVLYHLNKTRTR